MAQADPVRAFRPQKPGIGRWPVPIEPSNQKLPREVTVAWSENWCVTATTGELLREVTVGQVRANEDIR